MVFIGTDTGIRKYTQGLPVPCPKHHVFPLTGMGTDSQWWVTGNYGSIKLIRHRLEHLRKFLELGNMLANCAKLSWPPMNNILVFYMLKKAANLTDYLADAYYCRANSIRSLMCSWGYYQIWILWHTKNRRRNRCDGDVMGWRQVQWRSSSWLRQTIGYGTGQYYSHFIPFSQTFSRGISFTSHLGY